MFANHLHIFWHGNFLFQCAEFSLDGKEWPLGKPPSTPRASACWDASSWPAGPSRAPATLWLSFPGRWSRLCLRSSLLRVEAYHCCSLVAEWVHEWSEILGTANWFGQTPGGRSPWWRRKLVRLVMVGAALNGCSPKTVTSCCEPSCWWSNTTANNDSCFAGESIIVPIVLSSGYAFFTTSCYSFANNVNWQKQEQKLWSFYQEMKIVNSCY